MLNLVPNKQKAITEIYRYSIISPTIHNLISPSHLGSSNQEEGSPFPTYYWRSNFRLKYETTLECTLLVSLVLWDSLIFLTNSIQLDSKVHTFSSFSLIPVNDASSILLGVVVTDAKHDLNVYKDLSGNGSGCCGSISYPPTVPFPVILLTLDYSHFTFSYYFLAGYWFQWICT